MRNLSQDQRAKLRHEIATSLRDAAVMAEAASEMSSPDSQAKALLECVALGHTAVEHARYLRGIVNET